VRDLLVLLVDNLPLLLERAYELGAVVVGEEELLLVALVVLLDLHLAHHLVLVLDLLLDLLDVLRHLAQVLLLQVVLLRVHRQLRRRQDVLNGVRHDVVLVRHQAHDRLVLLLRDRRPPHLGRVRELADGALVLKGRLARALLAEGGRVRLQGALGPPEGQASAALRVLTAVGLVVAAHVGHAGFGRRLEGEGAGRGRHGGRVARPVALGLGGLVTLLGDQVEYALFKFHLFFLTVIISI